MFFNKIICTTIRWNFIQDIRISNIQYWAKYWAPERTITLTFFTISKAASEIIISRISEVLYKLSVSVVPSCTYSIFFSAQKTHLSFIFGMAHDFTKGKYIFYIFVEERTKVPSHGVIRRIKVHFTFKFISHHFL